MEQSTVYTTVGTEALVGTHIASGVAHRNGLACFILYSQFGSQQLSLSDKTGRLCTCNLTIVAQLMHPTELFSLL